MKSKSSSQTFFLQRGAPLQEIHIRVWRNERQRDWSVDINGECFENVAGDVIADLVDSALSVNGEPAPQTSVQHP